MVETIVEIKRAARFADPVLSIPPILWDLEKKVKVGDKARVVMNENADEIQIVYVFRKAEMKK